MDFQHLLERVAADAGADPDTVYREMQAALADAWQRRADSAEALALWEQLGFTLACPTPEQFLRASARKIRAEATACPQAAWAASRRTPRQRAACGRTAKQKSPTFP